MRDFLRKCFLLALCMALVSGAVFAAAEGTDEVGEWIDQAWKSFDVGDYETSLRCFLLAADSGNQYAQYMAAGQYAMGLGVDVDYEKAAMYYQLAADQDHAKALQNLGFMFQEGRGVEQDYEKAADWFHKAVEMGETSEGQINYDKLIEEGKIPADYVPKDITFEAK